MNINQQKLINLHIESRANVNVRHNAPDNIVVNILATDWRRHVICSKMTDTAPSPTELCGVRAAFYMAKYSLHISAKYSLYDGDMASRMSVQQVNLQPEYPHDEH